MHGCIFRRPRWIGLTAGASQPVRVRPRPPGWPTQPHTGVQSTPVNRRRKPAPELANLRRSIESRDAEDIDRLYGLEPVFEPSDTTRAGVEPEKFVPVQCPYCGERLETRVDLTAGEREYIEDCEVCCRPIELSIELDEAGALSAVRVQRLD